MSEGRKEGNLHCIAGATQLATLTHFVPPNTNILALKDYNVTLPPCCRDTWPTQLSCAVLHLLACPASSRCCLLPSMRCTAPPSTPAALAL